MNERQNTDFASSEFELKPDYKKYGKFIEEVKKLSPKKQNIALQLCILLQENLKN